MSLFESLRSLASRQLSSPDPLAWHQSLTCLEGAIGDLLMRKLGSKRCDLWTFLADLPGAANSPRYSHGEIWSFLWQGEPPKEESEKSTPPMLRYWGDLILFAFARLRTKESVHRCRCFERYDEPRKGNAMREACERKHTVERFPTYLAECATRQETDPDTEDEVDGKGPPTEASLSDEERAQRFVKRAVDGDSNLHEKREGMFRAFGNSMLCAVFTTPGEKGLYLVRSVVCGADRERKEVDRLVEVGEESLPDAKFLHAAGSSTSTVLSLPADCVWVCDHCECIVGGADDCQGSSQCVWRPLSIGTHLVNPTIERRLGSYCERRHVWPDRRRTTCPECGSPKVGNKHIPIPLTTLQWNDLCH
jgi:hypothetical protein